MNSLDHKETPKLDKLDIKDGKGTPNHTNPTDHNRTPVRQGSGDEISDLTAQTAQIKQGSPCSRAKPEDQTVSLTSQILTLIGYMLLIATGGVSWYWGGMSVYVLSFAIHRLDAGYEVEQPWIVSIFYITWTSGLLLSELLSLYLDKRLILVAGSIIGNGAMFLSYIVVQKSLLHFEILLGILAGIGDGLIQGVAIYYVIKVAGSRVGLFTSLLVSAHSFGGLAITQLFTWYINPQNKTPQTTFGSSKYFSQKDIIDKVPFAFVFLGYGSSGCHVIGYSLLLVNYWLKNRPKRFSCSDKRSILLNNEVPDFYSNGKETTKVREFPEAEVCHKSDKIAPKDYSPSEVIQTSVFYALWLSFFMADLPFILLVNFYKLYGQIWIADDHFLSNMGTAFISFTAVSRFMWGMSVDILGVRNSMVLLLSSIVVTVTWYYFTPMVSRWLYFIVTLVYGSFGGALYSYFMVATAYIFGQTHVATNYALLTSSSMIFNLSAPMLVDALLSSWGWFWVFAFAGGINIIGLVLCIVFIP